jgi:voltage-gated potassium channel
MREWHFLAKTPKPSAVSAPNSAPPSPSPGGRPSLQMQRWRLVGQLSRMLDKPMTALAFVWLGLLIIDFTHGLSGYLLVLNNVIWGLFGFHFLLEFSLAPRKREYLRRNWLTAVALVLPALRVIRVLRVFRVLRAARAVKSVSLLRLLTSLNRGMNATRRAMGRRGVGFVVATTVIVTFAGAAGMYAFENGASLRQAGFDREASEGKGLVTYAEALWWTAMMMTTMGSEYWPKTTEGRVLGFLLAVYAFAIFGYITATIASLFIGQDRSAEAAKTTSGSPGAMINEIAGLRDEIHSLREELARILAGVNRDRPANETGA